MKEFKVLKGLDRFRKLFEKLGVDYDVMRRILQVKLVMDGRRVPIAIGNSKKINQETDNNFIKSLWIYVIMGIMNVVFLMIGKSYIFSMSFVFGIMMFMVMTSLISDFSSVLLDVRDKNILQIRPINSMTLNMAKIIHITIYLFFITMALMVPALIVSILRNGILFFLIFFVEIILMDFLIVTLTALLYLAILRFFDGEKLKDIINYVQIILTMMIAVGYQLIGRLFDFSGFNITFQPRWWQYFVIPIWFGAPFEVLLRSDFNTQYVVFSLLVLIVPILSIFLYIKLIPTFERNLQKLNTQNSRDKRNKGRLLYWIANRICSSKEEKTFFRFALTMMKNEREFKLHVYPSLGFALIFPFIFIVSKIFDEGFASVTSSNLYFNIYFCALLLPTAFVMMQYSSNYKGAWIYKAMPINQLESVFKGCFKAVLLHLILPVYLFEGIVFTLIFGMRILPDLIVVLLNIIIFSLICFKALLSNELPFSKSFTVVNNDDKSRIIPLMTLITVLGGIHFGCKQISFGIYVYIAVAFIITIVRWKKTFQIS